MRTPEEKLLNPRSNSRIEAAKQFGIDLSLLVTQLRKTPQQRIDDLQSGMRSLAELDRVRESKLRAKS